MKSFISYRGYCYHTVRNFSHYPSDVALFFAGIPNGNTCRVILKV